MFSRFDKAWAAVAGPFITLVLMKLAPLAGLSFDQTEQAVITSFISGTLVYYVRNKPDATT